jgi:hypothetical protein
MSVSPANVQDRQCFYTGDGFLSTNRPNHIVTLADPPPHLATVVAPDPSTSVIANQTKVLRSSPR